MEGDERKRKGWKILKGNKKKKGSKGRKEMDIIAG